LFELPREFPATFRRAMALHAETPEHQRLVKSSTSWIRRLHEQYGGNLYVAFSGGKDSTVLVHLALSVEPDAWVYHYDYGDAIMPRGVESEILRNAATLGIRPERFVVRKTSRTDAIRDDPNLGIVIAAVTEETEEHGWKAGLLGFRDEESGNRKRRAANGGHWYSFQQKIPLFFPIHFWTWRDVYAYVVSRDLPIPELYHAYASFEGYASVRMASFFDSEFDAMGRPNLDGHVFPGFKHLE